MYRHTKHVSHFLLSRFADSACQVNRVVLQHMSGILKVLYTEDRIYIPRKRKKNVVSTILLIVFLVRKYF